MQVAELRYVGPAHGRRAAAATPRRVLRAGIVLLALTIGLTASRPAAAMTVGRVAASFNVDAIGAAVYDVPIAVAAGTGGLRPAISLRYNSQRGDGPAGPGWMLGGLSVVSRCPLTVALDGRARGIRFDGQDRVCLDGLPLVLVSGTYGGDGAEYRTEIHGYQRVYSRGRQGSGPAWFEVHQPDGTTWRYGNDADSRVEAVGVGTEIHEWALNEIADPFGNQVVYGYDDNQVTGEHLPVEIRWTADANAAGGRFRLRFGYEARPAADVRSGHLWGSTWSRTRRLAEIRYEHDAGSGFALVHQYRLTYLPPDAAGSQRSLPGTLELCGPRGCLPATSFGWQPGTPGFAAASGGPTDAEAGTALAGDLNGDGATDLVVKATTGSGPRWHVRLANPKASTPLTGSAVNTGVIATGAGYLLDFDGDGLRDLLTYGPAQPYRWHVYRANGSGGFLPGIDTGITTAAVVVPTPMDMDGDGLDDLVYGRDYRIRFRRNTGNAFGPEQDTGIVPETTAQAALLPGPDGSSVAADFDGDGRRDLLITRASLGLGGPPAYYEGFLSTGDGFSPLFTTPPALDIVPLDLNGDGLTDIAYRDRTLGWQTRISTGNGLMPPQPAGFSTPVASVARAVDFDGDGREDLLRRLDDRTWRVHLSSGAANAPALSNSDAARYRDVASLPTPIDTARLSVADVDADGSADLLFTSSTGRWQLSRRHGPRTDLLTSVTDGLGNAWRPAYQPLGRFTGYTFDGSAIPAGEQRVRGGGAHVVSSYSASDGSGGDYSVAYAYRNGRISRLGRGFLGFGSVRSSDSRYPALHGVAAATETLYRQDFPFVGRAASVTTAGDDGTMIAAVDYTWASRSQAGAASDATRNLHFVYWSRELRREYETDPTGGMRGQLVRNASRSRSFDFNHGRPVREVSLVTSPLSSLSFTTTTDTLLDDTPRLARNCLGLPGRVTVTRATLAGTSSRTATMNHSPVHCRQLSMTTGPAAIPADQLTTVHEWNGRGQLVSVTLSPGAGTPRRTLYGYEPWSDLPVTETGVIDGQPGLITRQAWNHGLGLVAARTNPRGLVTSWTYDDFGRPTTETRPGAPSVELRYAPCDAACFTTRARYQVRTLQADGAWLLALHDGFGRVVGHERPLTGTQVSRVMIENDALGRTARETVPYVAGRTQYWVTHGYDLAGRRLTTNRPVDETAPAGAITRRTHSGLAIAIDDEEGRRSRWTLDPEGRLIAVISPGGGTARYDYAPFGELAGVTDANGTRTTLGYDERGFLRFVDSPDTGRRTSVFNPFGELISQLDAKTPASAISFSYDQLGRLVRRIDAGNSVTTWEFNADSGPQLGLLRQVTSPPDGATGGYRLVYGYDALGRVTRTTTTLDGTNYVSDVSYDAQGRLDTLTYPVTVNGGRPRFRYRYGQAGHLDLVEQDLTGNGGLWLRIWKLQELDALGREQRVTLGDYTNVDEQHFYDAASTRLREIRTGPAMSSSRQNYAYAWDRVGNLLERRDRNQSLSEQFSYDAEDRLSSARLNGALTLAVTYDAGGRIRSRSDVGNYAYVATRPGAVSSIAGGPRGAMAFSYDANGNMVERQGRPITWTSFLQPRRISHGSSDYAEFSYGPERQRIRQVAGNAGVTTTTHYVNPRFEVELRGSSHRYRSNVYANGKVVYSLVEQDNPLTAEGYFLHRDHQDSVDTLTRVVGAGSDVSRLQFDAWGKRRNANWSADFADQRAVDAHFTERGYTGHEHLDNVRLIHMDGRLQDPQLGVMLSPDPVLGNLADPQTLNRYAYAAGNPSSSQDPSGFLLDRIGRFFKRLTGHVGSFVRRVVRNYGREIAAAITAYYTWSGVAEAYVAKAGAAGVSTGNTLGAVAGGAAGGAVATGNLRGVLGGAVGGGLFGAIDVAYGSQWPATRIAAHAVAGGIGVEIAGGDFRRGALLAGGLASARYVYNHVVGYDATFASGEPAQAKGRFDLPHEGVNNIGPAVRVIDPDALWNEGGRASRLLNRIPGVNAVAGLHDVFQVGLDVAGGARYGGFLRNALNFPGMPVAAAMTYPALLDGYPAIVLATDER